MHWLTRIFRKEKSERQLDAELRFHLEKQISVYIACGLSQEEARRRANLSFGGLEQTKEQVRTSRFETRFDNFSRDFRYAVRSLRKDHRFAAIAVFALALGIGASTAGFSVVENLLYDPYPYPNSNRFAVIKIQDSQDVAGEARPDFSVAEFLEYRAQNHVFEDLVGSYDSLFTYTSNKGTEAFLGAYVTANGFDFYGVPALLGRRISPQDATPGAPHVFAMNYKLWKSRFGGDPHIIGKSFILNGVARTLVGVMPPRFQAYGTLLWMPLSLRAGDDGMIDIGGLPIRLWTIGRLKRGIAPPAASADLSVIALRLAKLYPKSYPEHFIVQTQGLNDFVMGGFKSSLYALLAAVALLLLIACSNVANLLLSRATIREKEIALRVSLGATHGRLVRQFLVESFVLAVAACILGCLFAYFGVQGIVAIIPQGPLPDEATISLNPVVLGFAVLLALVTTLFCGLAPAVHALRKNLQPHLASSSKGQSDGSHRGKLRATLVVAEVALSMVLLCGAGLMLRSFYALTHVNLGFRPQSLFYAQIFFPVGRYDTPQQEHAFFSKFLPLVKRIPGVLSATEATNVPPLWYIASDVDIPGTSHFERWDSLTNFCSEGIFDTLDLRLLQGRLLTSRDVDSAQRVAVVNQAMARKYFNNADPVGRKIKFNDFDHLPNAPHDAYFEIIGVVSDIRNGGLQKPPSPEAFLPYTTAGLGVGFVLLKTAAPAASLLPILQEDVWTAEPDAAIRESGTLQSFLQQYAYVEPQFAFATGATFAGIGLLLVVIGVFSVMAYTVALHTPEIGVRMALGAQQVSILTMILGRGAKLIVAGIASGVLASLALTRFLANQIWGISANDPWTFAAVGLLVALTGLSACLLPARRAMRVDPIVALHYE